MRSDELLEALDIGNETGEEAWRLGRGGGIAIGVVDGLTFSDVTEGLRGGKGGNCGPRGGSCGFFEDSDEEEEGVVDALPSVETGLNGGDGSSLKSMRDDLRPRAAGDEGEGGIGCMGGMEQRASAVGDVQSESRICC